MEKTKVMNVIITGSLILMLLVVNLFFVYKIVNHKDSNEIIGELRDSVSSNIDEFKKIDEDINFQVEEFKGEDIDKKKEEMIKKDINKQKDVFIKVENLGQDNGFKRDINEISSYMRDQWDMNNFILSELVEKNIEEVDQYLVKKEDIIKSIDKSYIGLYNDMDKVIKPVDRENISQENANNIILGHWNDEINSHTYYFSKDGNVHITSNKKVEKFQYDFLGYQDGVFSITIKYNDKNINKKIILDSNNSMAKVKSVEAGNESMEYWSYVDAQQEPK